MYVEVEQEKASLYNLSKYAFQEILLEAQTQATGPSQSLFLEKYERRRNSIKAQIITMKIIYAILFTILPLIPIITYFQTSRAYVEVLFPFHVRIFMESLLFGLFFVFQFIYLFSMRVLNFGIIMSGRSFRFFETLPISKKKLKKLVFLTIYRSLDIPIIAMIFVFPITMLFLIGLNYGFDYSIINYISSYNSYF